MTDYTQLSLFSPIITKRLVSPAQPAASYWAVGTDAGRSKRASEERSSSGSAEGTQGSEAAPAATAFKRTKAKVPPSLVKQPE